MPVLECISIDDLDAHGLLPHGRYIAAAHDDAYGVGLQIFQPERRDRPADVDCGHEPTRRAPRAKRDKGRTAMRKQSLSLVVAAAFGLAASQASAADLPRKAPAYVPPAPP